MTWRFLISVQLLILMLGKMVIVVMPLPSWSFFFLTMAVLLFTNNNKCFYYIY